MPASACSSVAFLSEALDSIVNLAGASFALAMVSYARRPRGFSSSWPSASSNRSRWSRSV
jgi:hypothetical protein